MTNELASAPEAPPIVRVLQEATTLESISKALPRSIAPERFIRQAQTLVRTTPALLECPPAPLLASMIEAAQIGLELSTFLGEAYIVPFWDKRAGCKMPTLIPGYKGLVKLILQGEYVEAYAHEVRLNDEFVLELGTGKRIVHRPDPMLTKDERGHVIGCYAVAKTVRGGVEFEWMSIEDLVEIMNAAEQKSHPKSWPYSPWMKHTVQMFRKTVMRRLCNRLPKSDNAARAVQLAGKFEAGDRHDSMGVVDLGSVDFHEDTPPDYTPAVPMESLTGPEPLDDEDMGEDMGDFDEAESARLAALDAEGV